MKWQFEFTDIPANPEYPITAYQIYTSGAKKGPFYLSMKDFLTALENEPEVQYDPEALRDMEKNTPALPFGTIRYSENESQTRQRVTLEIPQKQWEVRYGEDNLLYTIGFPRMIIQYLVTSQKGVADLRIDETRIYAVLNNGQPITDETKLYIFPYPNVGKGNAIVCWGQNQRLTLQNLVELERMFRWFVSAPFNEDHGVRTTHGIPNFKKLLEEIQDKPFNDDWLMPTTNTFGELYE